MNRRNGPKIAAVEKRGSAKKKRQHEAGVKLLRQVSYRQETYRAVTPLYEKLGFAPRIKFELDAGPY
ncbi:hypothetical protein [Sulfitobacter geojensis]|jgi:hypothetical protein|uniref:hypothetical protein n=1 Tax=Sulfitobacter geojensis TaxID=1342299 RepID=UPI0007D90EE3|nr:hypothetical protein [Sulfitobacter geojensis]MBM1777821.1 hypothetical protein [Sulfitobacter geojensis]MBM1827103.1 hypothetical protein [Sulfitobacter geojensis]OAN97861.1 hypothetical protein A8B74_00430 [Sulfitobacter geojensis]